jgi:hypothetical protein
MSKVLENLCIKMCDWKRLRVDELIEGVDFYWEETDGIKLRVFTEEYLQMIRPKCCESGCRHCPWEYKKEDNKKTL